MAKLIISDLEGSKALDSKAMAAVRGGMDPAAVIALNTIFTATRFDSANYSTQAAVANNSVGAFNFGVVTQDNTQIQESNQAGNNLGA